MGLLELFILAIGLSMDAFAVSICKGLALPKINLKSAGIVGLWFGAFQALMPLIGYLLGVNFRSYIVSIDHWIAFVLLALIGANMIKEALSDDDEEEEAEIRNLKRGPEEGTIGVKIGNVFGLKYKSKAEIAGGVILILLGCKILIEHLGIL